MGVLRTRMTRDLETAGLAVRTREQYLASIRDLAKFKRRSPDGLERDDLRDWVDHLRTSGIGPDRQRLHLAAMVFLYRKTLGQSDRVSFVSWPKSPRRLPVVLSREEVTRLLKALREPRYYAFYALIYATGLRVSEAQQVQVGDIDRERGVIHVRNGKGGDDRLVMLPDALYRILRGYWAQERPAKPWLFAGKTGQPFCLDAARKALAMAGDEAGLRKKVTPHMLRHTFATHLHEDGVDLRTIQALMGHHSIRTTMIYTHISSTAITAVRSPLELLPP